MCTKRQQSSLTFPRNSNNVIATHFFTLEPVKTSRCFADAACICSKYVCVLVYSAECISWLKCFQLCFFFLSFFSGKYLQFGIAFYILILSYFVSLSRAIKFMCEFRVCILLSFVLPFYANCSFNDATQSMMSACKNNRKRCRKNGREFFKRNLTYKLK
jgi:hypothetical protein